MTNPIGYNFIASIPFQPNHTDFISKCPTGCYACAGVDFEETLWEKDGNFLITRQGYDDYGLSSHETLKDKQHPFKNFKHVIAGDKNDPYSKYLEKIGIILSPVLFGDSASEKWHSKQDYILPQKHNNDDDKTSKNKRNHPLRREN